MGDRGEGRAVGFGLKYLLTVSRVMSSFPSEVYNPLNGLEVLRTIDHAITTRHGGRTRTATETRPSHLRKPSRRRVAEVIRRKWGIDFNCQYFLGWLKDRGITSQKPQRQAREADPGLHRPEADPRLATPSKRARRQRATVVFIDQSGFLLNPPHPPLAGSEGPDAHPHRPRPAPAEGVRHRRVVAVAATASACSSAHARRLLPDRTRRRPSPRPALPLSAAASSWSGMAGKFIKPPRNSFSRKRLETVTLPSYVPALNPVEQVWNRLKWGDLANAAPVDCDELHRQLQPLLQQTANSALQLLKGCKTAIQKA